MLCWCIVFHDRYASDMLVIWYMMRWRAHTSWMTNRQTHKQTTTKNLLYVHVFEKYDAIVRGRRRNDFVVQVKHDTTHHCDTRITTPLHLSRCIVRGCFSSRWLLMRINRRRSRNRCPGLLLYFLRGGESCTWCCPRPAWRPREWDLPRYSRSVLQFEAKI